MDNLSYPKSPAAKAKLEKVFREAKAGKLRTSAGTKPKSRKQVIAIALSEARRAEAGRRSKSRR
jgi:hypothetical protein